jgi:putative Holliday junction resolvase
MDLPESILKKSEDEPARTIPGRFAALDIGAKRVGVAVSDELNISISPLPPIQRTSWKRLLLEVAELVRHYDAQALVIGLPLSLDGTEGSAALDVRRMAEKFRLSLNVPVCLQDERLTTFQAKENLRSMNYDQTEINRRLDSEAAAIILKDFIASRQL